MCHYVHCVHKAQQVCQSLIVHVIWLLKSCGWCIDCRVVRAAGKEMDISYIQPAILVQRVVKNYIQLLVLYM